MSKTVDFTIRRILDTKLSLFGVAGSSVGRRILDISAYGLTTTSVDLHVGSTNSTKTRDEDKIWVTGSLVKVPSIVITRGPQGLNTKKSVYAMFIKSSKALGEYVNEAVSAELESYFTFNEHITLNNEQVTILNSSQAPTVYLEGKTERYWNRVLIDCEMFYTNN